MPEAAVGEEPRADSTVVEEADPVLLARTVPDGVHHHLRVALAPDQTPTGLDRSRVPQADLLSLLPRPEPVVEADTEAVHDHTLGLHHHPRDVEEVHAVTTVTAEEGARVETATIATIAVDPGPRAVVVIVAVAAAAAVAVGTDESSLEHRWARWVWFVISLSGVMRNEEKSAGIP